ncbi:MAG: hypothetical protein HY742_09100, partial [Deltaproteobacteria bacterium]|nr:hypothetical protein [Deltaproteobacteria bacterium]
AGGRLEEALKVLASLKKPVDAFFDRVLVMDPDQEVRENRFRILRRIQDLFSLYGDFSQITFEKEGSRGL